MLSLCVFVTSLHFLLDRRRTELAGNLRNITEIFLEEVADGHDPTDPNVLWELSTDDDIVLLDDDEVDVTELARDASILDMDTKFLCSEDCKGLCPGCGADLNRESCRCKKAVDPRLAKLAQLLHNDE